MVDLYTQRYYLLDPRLESTVRRLSLGDGIGVEHERGTSFGYVTEVNGGFMTLAPTRDDDLAGKIGRILGKLRPIYYAGVDEITIIDPATRK